MTSASVDTRVAVARLIEFLESGVAPEGIFAPDMFMDLSLPHWRLQTATAEEAIAVRRADHPATGQVRVERINQTETGFVIEFEERWNHDGQNWYCREMIRAEVVGETIAEMSVYCTGDWDEAKQREHAGTVKLIRP